MLGSLDQLTIKIMSEADAVDYISSIVPDGIKIFDYNIPKLSVTHKGFSRIGYIGLQNVSVPV